MSETVVANQIYRLEIAETIHNINVLFPDKDTYGEKRYCYKMYNFELKNFRLIL